MTVVSGRLLAKNSLINLAGQVLPLLVGFVCIPILVDRLGMERFGVLSLAWLVIGYFNLFDFGLGRATVKLVAEKLGRDDIGEIAQIVWTSSILIFLISLAGSAFVYFLTPWLLRSVFEVHSNLLADSEGAFRFLAVGIPIVAMSTCFRGGLEAKQKFTFINFVNIFVGIFAFAIPVWVTQYLNSVTAICGVLVLGRVLGLGMLVVASSREFPGILKKAHYDRHLIRRLITFGGWMTVSNVISPLMVYFDRFLVGALVPIGNLAYYTTPFEIVNRLHVIPSSISRVLFPAFTSTYTRVRDQLPPLFRIGNVVVLAVFFPICLFLVYFSTEILTLWLGAEFALSSHRILEIVTIGVFVNAIAQIPFSLIQSLERADLTAKLHLAELPIYFALVWFLTVKFGLIGAACAWAIRVIVDAGALSWCSKMLVPGAKKDLKTLEFWVVILEGLLLLGLFKVTLGYRVPLVVGILAVYFFGLWYFVLNFYDRVAILRTIESWFVTPDPDLQFAEPYEPPKDRPPSVVAVYVTSFPTEVLAKSVRQTLTQVDEVLIVDIGSTGLSFAILNGMSSWSRVSVMFAQSDVGLASALNQGINWAMRRGATWVLTMGQSLLVGKPVVSETLRLISRHPQKDRVCRSCPIQSTKGWAGTIMSLASISKVGYLDSRLPTRIFFQEFLFRSLCKRVVHLEFIAPTNIENCPGQNSIENGLLINFGLTHSSYGARLKIALVWLKFRLIGSY